MIIDRSRAGRLNWGQGSFFPFVGGAEVAVKEITDRISDIEFDMITARMDRKLPKFERVGNVNVYRMGFGVKALDKIILAVEVGTFSFAKFCSICSTTRRCRKIHGYFSIKFFFF